MTDERVGDATQTDRFAELQFEIEQPRIVGYRNSVTGVEVGVDDPRVDLIRLPSGRQRHIAAPAPLTAAEQAQAATSIQAVFDELAEFSPALANSLKNNPELIPYMTELQLSVNYEDPTYSEPAVEFGEALLQDPVDPNRMNSVREQLGGDGSLGMFWTEASPHLNSTQREVIAHALAGITEHGADRVAARAMRWTEEFGYEDPAVLVTNVYQWIYAEQQKEFDDEGFFKYLELSQNIGEQLVSKGLTWLDGKITSPEEAARRADMTEGERMAALLGIAPSYHAGEMGLYQLVTGGVDAWGEVALDPLNLLAGIGLGTKALKTVNIGAKTIKSGKLAAAGRSVRAFFAPRRLSGVSRRVSGGRVARAMYAWSPKTLDNLLDGMKKSGVARDIQATLAKGDIAQFHRKYPQFNRLSETAMTAIAKAPDEETVVEVLRHAAANNLVDDGFDATKAAHEAIEAAGRQLDQPATVAAEYGDEVIEQMDNLKDFEGAGVPYADDALEAFASIADESDEALGTFQHADETFELRYSANPTEGRPAAGGLPPVAGRERPTWYVLNQAGEIVGGYSPDAALQSSVRGLMHSALQQSEAAGKSFLPTLLNRAEEGANFSEDGARFLRNAIKDRLPTAGPRSVTEILERANELPVNQLQDILVKVVEAETRSKIGRQTVFTLWDVPRKIAKTKRTLPSFVKGTGRFSQALRRGLARTTGPAVEDEINVFQRDKGANQIRKLLEHYGADSGFVNAALDEWYGLRPGQRFDWVMETMLPRLGEHIDVPVLEYNLKQYFTKKGMRRFASGLDEGVDHWVDTAGRHRYDPIIPAQMQSTIPIPIDEIDQIVRRYKAASRNVGAIALRGWAPSTQKARKGVVQRFHQALVEKGKMPEGPLTPELEDQLYAMAYSFVNNVGDDGRGVLAGNILPKLGTGWSKLHGAFTKSMLVLRPFQWVWRVAIVEEQLRGYMMNMPSFYRNPITYMHDLKDAALLSGLNARRVRALGYAQEVHDVLMGGVKNAEEAKKILQNNGLWSVISDALEETDELPSLRRIDSILSEYLSKAVNDRTRLDRLEPVKKASLRVRRDVKKIEKGEEMLEKMGRTGDFDLVDDVPEIQQRMLQTYFGWHAGASSPAPRFWSESMSEADAYDYGYAYAAKIQQYLHDDFARLAFRRILDQRAGTPRPANSPRALTELGHWPIMRDMLAERFGIVDDDVALARKYLDDVLTPELEGMLAPLTQGMDEGTSLRVLRDLEMNRRYRATLGGIDYDIDLTSGNMGGSLKDFGNLVIDQRPHSNQITFPRQITGVNFDPRFMATDDQRFYTRWSNHILQFAGEGVTQTLNRRPAYLRTYRRYFDHYREIGVTESLARNLAHDHAAEAVNYVYFNAADAPYLIQKMNKFIPFFTATYEVMSTWTWKMPRAVGGYWATGAGEFARRMDRLMDGLVNVGLVTREKQDDGSITHTVNLTPNEEDYSTEVGAALGNLGFQAIRGLAFLPEQVLNLVMENDADGLYDDGVSLTVGHPLNPQDYGILSFAQANVGLNPVPNLVVSALAATTGLAADTKRTQVEEGETLADVAGRLDVEVAELARHNRGVLTDMETFDFDDYDALLNGQITADQVTLPAGTSLYNPATSMWDAVEDIFMPFGKITDWSDLPMNFLPGVIRWGIMGLGVAQTPIDDFWKGDFDAGLIGGLIPDVNQSQMAGQTSEAMMYLEAHDRVGGLGPWERIENMKAKLSELLESDRNDENRDKINRLEEQIAIEEREYLEKVRNLTAGSLVTRMMLGQVLPTAPRHLRAEQTLINDFWASREYADKLKANQMGIENLRPFKSEDEILNFFDSVGRWLKDNTGDDMRAKFLNENPALLSYLTPKSFWADGGTPPQLNTFQEWQDAVIRGDIEQAPLAVTLGRARSSAIQTDFYTEIQTTFGGETPEETVANALNNWDRYQEIVSKKNRAYDALFMEDDFMGGEYEEWLNSRTETDFALEKYQEIDNNVRDSMTTLLQMEQELDGTYELSEIQNLRSSIRGALSKLSDTINEWEDLAGKDNSFANPFEQAMNRYWKEVYEPYSEEVGALYDSIDETFDSEERSLIFEQIKMVRNRYTNTDFYFEGNDVPMPSPLDIQWERKTDEERTVWLQSRIKNPMQWLDLDAVTRITEVAPHLEESLPSTDRQMLVYQQYTLDKIKVDEAYEREEITSGERTKLNRSLEERLTNELLAEGRGAEVEWMNLYPIERLNKAGLLPPSMEYLLPEVRWYKQVLEANDIGANAGKARKLLDPFYQKIKIAALQDPQLNQDLFELGSSLYDETTYDKLLPQFLFGLFDLQED